MPVSPAIACGPEESEVLRLVSASFGPIKVASDESLFHKIQPRRDPRQGVFLASASAITPRAPGISIFA